MYFLCGFVGYNIDIFQCNVQKNRTAFCLYADLRCGIALKDSSLVQIGLYQSL